MSTKLDFQLKLLVYQKQLELSFFQNVAKTTKRSFSLLYILTDFKNACTYRLYGEQISV